MVGSKVTCTVCSQVESPISATNNVWFHMFPIQCRSFGIFIVFVYITLYMIFEV